MGGFTFDLDNEVKIIASGETGIIKGRAEYVNAANSYYIEYKQANGVAVTQWWDQNSIILAD